ncbi:MAG: hypothetical protein H7Y36_12380 [Armatimonadetes bacterium]|nr:hypothetical protein [Akkermansiaceae bacterium]
MQFEGSCYLTTMEQKTNNDQVINALSHCAQHLSTGKFGLKAAARLAEIQTGFASELIEASYPETHDARRSIPYELGWPISAAAAADNPFFRLEPGVMVRGEDDDLGTIIQIDQNGDIHIAFEGKPRAKCFSPSRVFLE